MVFFCFSDIVDIVLLMIKFISVIDIVIIFLDIFVLSVGFCIFGRSIMNILLIESKFFSYFEDLGVVVVGFLGG